MKVCRVITSDNKDSAQEQLSSHSESIEAATDALVDGIFTISGGCNTDLPQNSIPRSMARLAAFPKFTNKLVMQKVSTIFVMATSSQRV